MQSHLAGQASDLPRMERGREVARRWLSRLRMRHHSVEVELPIQQPGSGLGQVGKQRLVQQLIPQAAVEAIEE